METAGIVGSIGIGAVVTVILAATSCTCIQNQQDNQAVMRMVERGADPISAACAIRSMGNTICAVAATHGTQLPSKP